MTGDALSLEGSQNKAGDVNSVCLREFGVSANPVIEELDTKGPFLACECVDDKRVPQGSERCAGKGEVWNNELAVVWYEEVMFNKKIQNVFDGLDRTDIREEVELE